MEIKDVQKTLESIKEKAIFYFSSAKKVCGKTVDENGWPVSTKGVSDFWDKLPDDLQENSLDTQKITLEAISSILPFLNASPILDKSDEKDIGLCAKKMRSALRLRKYKSWEIEVLHDERSNMATHNS